MAFLQSFRVPEATALSIQACSPGKDFAPPFTFKDAYEEIHKKNRLRDQHDHKGDCGKLARLEHPILCKVRIIAMVENSSVLTGAPNTKSGKNTVERDNG